MANIESKVTYFEQLGRHNTNQTLKLAKARADQLGIKNIVVASYTGDTGVKTSKVFSGVNCVIVAGVVGFREPNQHRMSSDNLRKINENGGVVFHATHAFGTLGRAVHRRFEAIQIDEIIAHVLRLFGAGVKVACEIACMAVDAGLIRTDEDAICIGGTGGGADTAVVLRPSNTHTFFETRIKEIICKPRL